MRARRFFLYGTLLGDTGTAMARALESRLGDTAPASVTGRLFAVPSAGGWFPALLRGGTRWVSGRVCTLRLGPGDLAWLDRYEGAQYRRQVLSVHDRTGRHGHAEAYVWCAPLPPGARRIADGNFLAWLEQTGARAFS